MMAPAAAAAVTIAAAALFLLPVHGAHGSKGKGDDDQGYDNCCSVCS